MKNTTEVPNELLIEAHKEASSELKLRIEEVNPELFKPNFKVGDWCRSLNIKDYNNGVSWIGRIKRFDDSGDAWLEEQSIKGKYSKENYREICVGVERLVLATPSEVESHLIKVAEEKGYLKGVKIKSDYSNKEGVITGAFFMNDGDLCVNVEGNKSILVFDNETGKWATIIPQEEVRADKSKFKFGEIVIVVDGSSNKDKKTGEKRHGIDNLFKKHKAVVIETNLNIPSHEDFEINKKEGRLKPWMFSDLLLRFETGEEVYVSSEMCIKK